MENGAKKSGKAVKVINIILNVLAGIFFVLCMFALIASVAAKRNNGAANVFGHQMRVVISESMAKCDQTDVSGYEIKDIPLRSMVFIELVPEDAKKAEEWYSKLKKGDVLTFRYYYSNTQMTVTHRITAVTENPDGGYTIELQGDNKGADDPTGGSGVLTQIINTATDTPDTYKYIIGKVTGQSLVLGHIVYAVSRPIGLALIVMVPCGIIIIVQIVRIIGVLTEDKKKKAQEIQDKKDDEIEQLKRRLAEFESGKARGTGADGGEDSDERA